jgi:hypothetical protein
VDLRRGDHSAESLRIERERLEMDRAEQKEELERQFWEWAKERKESICPPFLTEQERTERIREILGISEAANMPRSHDNGNGGAVCPPPSPQSQ